MAAKIFCIVLFLALSDFLLRVSAIRPAIVENIVTEVRPIDSTATLNCSVALFSNPPERVQWYKLLPGQSDKAISAGTKITEQNPILQGDMLKYEVRSRPGRTVFIPDMGYTDVTTFTLLIRRLTNLDAANYKCRINVPGSPADSPEVVATLIVPREPFINPAEVTNNQVVEEGANVTLKCSATSEPPAHISWIRANGLPLNIPGRPQRVYQSEVTLINVTKYDRGVYRCFANNNVGYGAKHDVRIDVNYAPSIRGARLHNLYLQAPERNYEITLECVSTGYPDPEVTFYSGTVIPRPDQPLPDSQVIKNQFPFSVERLRSQGAAGTHVYEFFYALRIKNVRDTHLGNYTCVAKNKYGVDAAVLKLANEEVCQGPLCFGTSVEQSANSPGAGHRSAGSCAVFSGLAIAAFMMRRLL
ncbi:hypothetical protein BOX15_Mlig034109g1 [Macrostomum lignano]|uniref:Uncharacterized protein n=2 Tax=Macrostomum lignano TaxID=282301 RepID=A0A267DXH7_9PLAT|nr:hypothetical protein BOX15_Mlig034109g1 [Macrostomum lignano]